MRRSRAPHPRQPARLGAHVQRQGRRPLHHQRRQLRHLPHGFPRRHRPILARDGHEVDVPLRRHRRRRHLLPPARRSRLRRTLVPHLGRNRLRGRRGHVRLLPDGPHRPALPAAHRRLDVQLRPADRRRALHRRHRARHLRAHEGICRALRLRRRMARHQVEVPRPAGGRAGPEKGRRSRAVAGDKTTVGRTRGPDRRPISPPSRAPARPPDAPSAHGPPRIRSGSRRRGSHS